MSNLPSETTLSKEQPGVLLTSGGNIVARYNSDEGVLRPYITVEMGVCWDTKDWSDCHFVYIHSKDLPPEWIDTIALSVTNHFYQQKSGEKHSYTSCFVYYIDHEDQHDD